MAVSLVETVCGSAPTSHCEKDDGLECLANQRFCDIYLKFRTTIS